MDRPAPSASRTCSSAARRTRGFMPDDEGEALFLAGLRAGREEIPGAAPTHLRRDRGLVRQVDRVPRRRRRGHRRRAALHRPPPGLRGEPARVGVPRGRPRRPRGRSHRHAGALAAHHRGAGLEASVMGVVGDSPTFAARWDRPLAFCFIDGGHGEEPAWADFRGWAPLRRRRWMAGHSRRLPRSGRRRAAALRALPGRARLG